VRWEDGGIRGGKQGSRLLTTYFGTFKYGRGTYILEAGHGEGVNQRRLDPHGLPARSSRYGSRHRCCCRGIGDWARSDSGGGRGDGGVRKGGGEPSTSRQAAGASREGNGGRAHHFKKPGKEDHGCCGCLLGTGLGRGTRNSRGSQAPTPPCGSCRYSVGIQAGELVRRPKGWGVGRSRARVGVGRSK